MATDPVCKKEVDENAPNTLRAQFWGKRVYFCSDECRINFRRDPQKYAPDSAEGKGPEYDKTKTNESWRV